ncbi:MAG: PIN domain-containing protein [Thiohalomonadaceae bacterium]
MIGLDTNILVRYITQDDADQAMLANHLIAGHCSKDTPCRISQIVLCELVWVLAGPYAYSKAQILAVLDQLLITAELDVENEALAWQALQAWRAGPADYADYLIVLSNQAAGCVYTYSFDSKLTKHPLVSFPEK